MSLALRSAFLHVRLHSRVAFSSAQRALLVNTESFSTSGLFQVDQLAVLSSALFPLVRDISSTTWEEGILTFCVRNGLFLEQDTAGTRRWNRNP